MRLFVMDDCDECNDVMRVVKEKNIDLTVINLEKKDGKYFTKSDDEGNQAQVEIDATPTLYIEKTAEDGILLSGKEGIIDVLTKGYLHKIKICPHLGSACKEKDCELFSIIMNNNIPEGKCAEAWTPIFMLDFITGVNKYIVNQENIINAKKE